MTNFTSPHGAAMYSPCTGTCKALWPCSSALPCDGTIQRQTTLGALQACLLAFSARIPCAPSCHATPHIPLPSSLQSFLPDATSDEERFLSVFVAGSVAGNVKKEASAGLASSLCMTLS